MNELPYLVEWITYYHIQGKHLPSWLSRNVRYVLVAALRGVRQMKLSTTQMFSARFLDTVVTAGAGCQVRRG